MEKGNSLGFNNLKKTVRHSMILIRLWKKNAPIQIHKSVIDIYIYTYNSHVIPATLLAYFIDKIKILKSWRKHHVCDVCWGIRWRVGHWWPCLEILVTWSTNGNWPLWKVTRQWGLLVDAAHAEYMTTLPAVILQWKKWIVTVYTLYFTVILNLDRLHFKATVCFQKYVQKIDGVYHVYAKFWASNT